MKKKGWNKGSMTVEAAFVIPAVWFCIGLLLALNFYVHNRVWYQAAAWEAALAGNSREGDQKGGGPEELAREKLENRLQEQIMPGRVPDSRVSGDAQGTEIRLEGQVLSLGSRAVLTYQAEARASRVRPVEFLRRYRVLQQMAGTE